MKALSVVMPCHNSGYNIRRVLQAYDRQDTDEAFEVIAVDDASSDDTYEKLTNFQPQRFSLVVEKQDKNQGPGAARNRAFGLANSPLILFVGDDILPEADFIRRHLQIHSYYPSKEYAILGRVTWPHEMPTNTLMQHIDGPGAQQFSYHFFEDGNEYDYRHFYTANISVKKELLESVERLFDPDFTYAAFEDIELAYRLRKKGLRIIYSSAPVGRHYHYHTIWTFSQRQYRAGLMACVFDSKHPNVAGISPRLFRRYGRIISLLQGIALRIRGTKPAESEYLESIALAVLSYYEWLPNQFLDSLYLSLLAYYWRKGVIDGIFGEKDYVSDIHSVHANQVISPSLNMFLEEAVRNRIPIPQGVHDFDLN